MNVLITGVVGFIGSHLAERLKSLGHNVVGVDSISDYYSLELKNLNKRDLIDKGIKVERLDLSADPLKDLINGIDVVFHLAAQPGISDKTPFEAYLKNNFVATHKLIEAFKDSKNLKMFVNISTSSVYGAHATDSEDAAPKPTSYYGVTKLAAEQLVLAYQRDQSFPACSLRLFSVYGERERPEKLFPQVINSILNPEYKLKFYKGSKKHIRSYTYVGDIIDGMVLVLENLEKCNGEIFNFGTEEAITTGESLKIIEGIMGEAPNMETAPKRVGDQKETRANVSKARKILG